MPSLNLTTPALLFPAISLVLLAYGNRFLALGQIVRQLHPGEAGQVSDTALRQLPSLRRRRNFDCLAQWLAAAVAG